MEQNNNENRWCVYMHVNKTNNKIYVGITSQRLSRRWHGGNGYKTQQYFWRAIQKYGWDGFEHIVFADNLSKDDACHMEKCLIALYNTTDRQYGYNISIGGEGAEGCKWTQQQREKRQAYRATDETRKKISENHADVKGGKHPRAKAVLCIELNIVFDCTRDAERALGISHVHISNCCKGDRKHAGGYQWKYVT